MLYVVISYQYPVSIINGWLYLQIKLLGTLKPYHSTIEFTLLLKDCIELLKIECMLRIVFIVLVILDKYTKFSFPSQLFLFIFFLSFFLSYICRYY